MSTCIHDLLRRVPHQRRHTGTGTALLIGLGIIAGVTIGIIRERRRP